MNNQQLQVAIDKCLNIILNEGTNLKQHQPYFYEKFLGIALHLLSIQAERAKIMTQPTLELLGKQHD
jgi:hypothetical protein